MQEQYAPAIAVLALGVLIVLGLLLARYLRGANASDAPSIPDPEAPPRPPPPVCEVCRKRPPERQKPRTIYRWVDYATHSHATRGYGLPPRPLISTEQREDGEDTICRACEPLCVRLLERFQADQYGELCRITSGQAADAAAFEARGLVGAAREALGLEENA